MSLWKLLRLHQINAFVVGLDSRICLLGLGAGGWCRNLSTASTKQGKSCDSGESADAEKTCDKTGFIHRNGFPLGATVVRSLAKGDHEYSAIYRKSGTEILVRGG